MCKSLRQYGVVFTRTQFCTWHYLPRKENKSALDKRDAFYQWNNFLPKTTSLNVVLAEGELCNLGSGCAQVPSAALCRTRVRNLRVMIWVVLCLALTPFPLHRLLSRKVVGRQLCACCFCFNIPEVGVFFLLTAHSLVA